MLDDASTKIRSAHVDRLYVRRPHPFRSARFICTFGCFAIAAIWSIVYGMPARSRVHDPGPLSGAHRQWQNDCKRCHDGADSGGMFKRVSLAVSDSACLQCHDGAIHQSNQSHFISNDKSRSSNCVACHIEHKGGEALAANQDQTCVQCHGNLSSELAGAKSDVTNLVAAFNLNKHPKFGLAIPQKDGKPVDPTVLRFNHAVHMKMSEIQSNCVLCHEQREPSPLTKSQAEKTPPPWTASKDRRMAASGSSDGRYMQPISYERHCQRCHPLNLPGNDVRIAHEDMSLVRAQLQSMDATQLKFLGDASAGGSSGGGRRLPGQRPAASESKSVNDQAVEKLTALTSTWPADRKSAATEKISKIAAAIKTAPGATTQPTKPDANFAEFYVAYASSTSCSYCHEMQGDVPALSTSRDTLLTSVPTMIPDAPRRWFTASQFDHRAHRGAACTACHIEAEKSTDTATLLQPNIDNCVTCHRSEVGNQHIPDTAPSNCITCHQFHDRRIEKWGNGKLSLTDFAGKTSSR